MTFKESNSLLKRKYIFHESEITEEQVKRAVSAFGIHVGGENYCHNCERERRSA